MSNSIILTSRNQNPTLPNQFVYNFPSTQNFSNHEIALSHFSIYNSFFNIEEKRGNNKISFTFNALIPETHEFILSDGYYEISDINYAFQNYMQIHKLHLVDEQGKNIFCYELLANSIQYAIQQSFYVIPTEAQANANVWLRPTGATWNFPNQETTCQISFNADFGKIIGFSNGVYPESALNYDKQYISPLSPTVQLISSIFLTCNLINSPYSNPSNIIGNSAITSSFGDLILLKNSAPIFFNIMPSQYNDITINLLSQDFGTLPILDKEVVIILIIKEKTKQ